MATANLYQCMVSYVGNNSTPPYTYSIQSLLLSNVVTAIKDLGVMFDVKFKFNVNINNTVVKALARSNLTIKCLSRDPKTVFFSLICNVCKIYFRIRIVCLVSLLSYLY